MFCRDSRLVRCIGWKIVGLEWEANTSVLCSRGRGSHSTRFITSPRSGRPRCMASERMASRPSLTEGGRNSDRAGPAAARRARAAKAPAIRAACGRPQNAYRCVVALGNGYSRSARQSKVCIWAAAGSENTPFGSGRVLVPLLGIVLLQISTDLSLLEQLHLSVLSPVRRQIVLKEFLRVSHSDQCVDSYTGFAALPP
ncbi:hypothetical protein ACVILH_002153 [Bradyrhizobium sp. USDA 4353]